MSNFPHSRLFLATHRTVVISGSHIQILDSKCVLCSRYPPHFLSFLNSIPFSTGNVLHSTANFDHQAKDGILKSGHIRCAAIDVYDAYLATSGDDKMLKVWQLDGLKLLSVRYVIQLTRMCTIFIDEHVVIVSCPKSQQASSSPETAKPFLSLINLGTYLVIPFTGLQIRLNSRNLNATLYHHMKIRLVAH